MIEKKKYSYTGGTSNLSLSIPTPLLMELNQMAEELEISRNKLMVSAITTMIEKWREGR